MVLGEISISGLKYAIFEINHAIFGLKFTIFDLKYHIFEICQFRTKNAILILNMPI